MSALKKKSYPVPFASFSIASALSDENPNLFQLWSSFLTSIHSGKAKFWGEDPLLLPFPFFFFVPFAVEEVFLNGTTFT